MDRIGWSTPVPFGLPHRLSYVPPGRSGSSSPVPANSGNSPESRVSGLFQNHKLLYVD
ncbi:hypothetical protein T01_7851 [Trichinella spiralis]|uniref:Uncharacterized protein n=1 Tax=Trichinella spiralis TaxID=6334 RepID=A0A0V1BXB9_TRISP|nr:hypothetical protein T01_7851 [Trichinella spiralis]